MKLGVLMKSVRAMRALTAAVLVLALLGVLPLAAAEGTGVGAIAFPIADLERSVSFFTDVLSFREVSRSEAVSDEIDRLTGVFGTNVRAATLALGEERIRLVQYVTPEGRPVPLDSASNDGWFQHIAIVVSDMDEAYNRLRSRRVKQISTDPQTLPEWNTTAAGIRAIYFRDPDNHPLELIYFPPGKGNPKWHRNSDNLFLGIDHTAIATADTDASVRFYQALGFRVAGESLNYGREQERLNHIFGSRVRITGMSAGAGPGVELLEYITPGSGRPYPPDSRPNDLWHVSTAVLVDDFERTVEQLRDHGVSFISPDAASLDPIGGGDAQGVLVRDPDGHALLIRSR